MQLSSQYWFSLLKSDPGWFILDAFKHSTIWWKIILVINNSVLHSQYRICKSAWEMKLAKYRLDMTTLKVFVKSIKIRPPDYLRIINLQ